MKDKRSFALELEHLSVTYDRVQALWDLSLQVPRGVIAAIIGPNGAGKSTLLKTIMGFISPVSGSIRLLDNRPDQLYHRIGYVPQRTSVDWNFPITVNEVVLMGRYGALKLFQRPRQADREAAQHYLSLVELEEYGNRQISQLSGGQQQRAFLARALMQDADLYFLDEPLAGIDHTSERVIMNLLKRMAERGKTVLAVHHDLGTVESYYNWAILLNARLVAAGPLEEVFTAENLEKTYGIHHTLLNRVQKQSKMAQGGLRD